MNMIIDSCYQGVVEKLTKQGVIKDISKELLKLETNDERTLFVYSILEDLNSFPNVLKLGKSNDISTHYRCLGNIYYQQNDFFKAFQYYNVSLTNAPYNSENYCTAISNRSIVLYKLKKYKESLKDVEYVLSLDCPEKLLEKLNTRKNMCIKALAAEQKYTNKMEKVESLVTMKGPCDPTYVCASSKLEVVYSDEMGRHVCAKEDINVGEVLVIEDPYFTLLLKSQYLLCCSYCLLSNLNLLPCNNCCFAMYCSEECKVRALKEYHSVECDLMATLFKMEFTKLELSALRTVIKARNDHADWKSLFETIKEADANMNTKHQGQVKVGDKWLYDSKYYTSIHTLATNVEKRSISDIFQKAISAAVFLRFLKLNTTFLQCDNNEEQDEIFKCVAGLLLLHLMTVPTNMHGISTNVMNENGLLLSDVSVASGAYAFLSLINHSCAPNVVRFSKEGEGIMTLFALRPIKKGMQIFDNYGSHHAMEDYSSRQSSLKFQYKFTCVCEACVDKWPTYVQLNMMPTKDLPVKICQKKKSVLNQHAIRQLQNGDVCTALNIYKDLCVLCEQFDKYAPCVELCDCQEALKQCFMIFEGFRTFGSDDVIEWTEITTKTFNGPEIGALNKFFFPQEV